MLNIRRATIGVVIFILAVHGVLGCQPPQYPPTVNTDLNVCVRDPECTAKLAVGHRGTGSYNLWAPENTLAAYEMAWSMGCDSIEIDVRDTVDGIPIIMHDSTVDRMTDGTGYVAEMTLEEIKALHIYGLNPAVPVQSVPTFTEVLRCLKGKTLVDVDIKNAEVGRLVEIIASEDMLDAAYLLISSIEEGMEARAQHSQVALMPKVSSVAEVLAYIDALSPIDMFEIEYEDATPEVVDLIHSYGIKIHMDALGLFDILGEAGFEMLLARGADIIQTDRLEILVPYLHTLP